jgi:hypothetical protein
MAMLQKEDYFKAYFTYGRRHLPNTPMAFSIEQIILPLLCQFYPKLLIIALARRAFANKRLLNTRRPFWIGRFKTIQQPVGAGFQKLGNSREGCHGKRKIAMFNRANGLHMDARQFRKTLLSQTGIEASLTDVPPKHTQDFAIIHSQE